ncbi:MAG TPA: glycosyltransferase family 4 protein [Chloroflexota bacterium]|nr:glycosyltransferase family 4 protein [Chloroflexota bacterium]
MPARLPATVLVMPLGEVSRAQVEAIVVQHFGTGVDLEWFDRAVLRGSVARVAASLLGLWRREFAAAVLVAPDLQQSRLRITSLLLALAPARHKCRLDLRGTREPFSTPAHLAHYGAAIVRHLAACAAARVLGEPLLHLVDRVLRPRRIALRRPRRILYLRSQLWLGLAGGGSVAHTAGVIGGLEQAGVAVQVVSSDGLPGVNVPTDVIQPEMWFDGRLRELEDVAYNVAFGVAAWRTARRTPAQLIYQRHTAFNCTGAVLSRLLRVPLVLEFNSSELWKGQYWGGLHYRRVAALVERINLRAADGVVVVSEVLRTQLIAQGVGADKILVNPNAVDPLVFGPHVDGSAVRRRLGLAPSDVVIGFSGTFGLWHGIPSLAAVLPFTLEARPNVRWLLIGNGPLRRLVEEVVEEHGLHASVLLPGLVPHGEMPGYLAACDVLVSPHGRQADGGEFFGSPTKLFEYMATGRAIVASAVGQIADVLRDGETALLVPPDEPAALGAAIVRLIDDAPLRSRLGEQAREVAVARHTWRQNAERLLGSLR